MTKIVMTRRGGVLIAADEDARTVLDAIGEGKDVMVEVKPARNPRHHRLYFGLMKLLVDNTDGFADAEHASTCVKIACHEVDTFISPDTGEVHYVPRSIAWEKMSQDRFARFFDRALWVICNRWLIGTDQDALRQEVYQFVDGDERSSLGRRAA